MLEKAVATLGFIPMLTSPHKEKPKTAQKSSEKQTTLSFAIASKEKINAIKQELLNYSPQEKFFLLAAMLCGFFITADYAIIRPVSNSVFIHSYTSQFFPYAWLAAVPLNLILVSLYNRYLPKLGCLKMCFIILSLIVGGNVLFALFLKKVAFLPFIFYVWKDIYVMLMFQQLWSVIHTTIEMKKAKYLYGIIFGVGGLGALFGSLVPGFLAVKMGSERLLFSSLPIYGLFMVFYVLAIRNSGKFKEGGGFADFTDKQSTSWLQGIKLIRNSHFLIFILTIVVLMQFGSTILDFQFNTVLEANISDKDLRTQYYGRMMSIVQIATMSLQFVGTFLLVQFLGLKRSHFAVPSILCLNTIGFLLFPAFGMITYSFITVKAFDFSVFNVIKEMLYIPMKTEEKFRAKAIIDVFAYRSSKAFASCLILFLQLFANIPVLTLLSWSAIILFCTWCAVVSILFKKYDSPQALPNSST